MAMGKSRGPPTKTGSQRHDPHHHTALHHITGGDVFCAASSPHRPLAMFFEPSAPPRVVHDTFLETLERALLNHPLRLNCVRLALLNMNRSRFSLLWGACLFICLACSSSNSGDPLNLGTDASIGHSDAAALSEPDAAIPEEVEYPNPKGFARETIGGVEGASYWVTSLDDSANTTGTLRNAIEMTTGPLHVRFDPTVFVNGTEIVLTKPLRIRRSNITIDGNGAEVRIVRQHNWSDILEHKPALDSDGNIKPNTYECDEFKPELNIRPGIINISNSREVVVANLHFDQIILGDHGLGDVYYDAQCFGDQITMGSRNAGAGDTLVKGFLDNIWIDSNQFSRCRDECIGVTHHSAKEGDPAQDRARISISNNTFLDTNKVVLIGNNNDEGLNLLVSFYSNTLTDFGQRGPRIQNAIVHVFNNYYKNWEYYVVGARSSSRVIIENNTFIGERNLGSLYPVYANLDEDAHRWARSNCLHNILLPALWETDSYPATQENGGPWYYSDEMVSEVLPEDCN